MSDIDKLIAQIQGGREWGDLNGALFNTIWKLQEVLDEREKDLDNNGTITIAWVRAIIEAGPR